LLAEVLPALMMVGGAFSNLKAWMRPERRGTLDPVLACAQRGASAAQGRGADHLALELSLQLTVGPLAAALAAGNRVIVKPSEITPATSELLKAALEEGFGADRVTVALGGPEVAEGLCRLPFDHILFTGSTASARR
jgi:hypothetical protein